MSAHLVRIAAVALLGASSALAHDRHGNAAMNQDVHVLIAKDHVDVTFTLDTNDEGRIIEAIAMDANGDGKLSPEEQSAYFAQLDARLREGLQVSIGSHDIALAPSGHVELARPARKTFHFRGPIALVSHIYFEVHNDNFLDWPGRSALKVEVEDTFDLRIGKQATTEVEGTLVSKSLSNRFPNSNWTKWIRSSVDWSGWSFFKLILTRPFLVSATLVILITACFLMLGARERGARKFAGAVLIVASLALGAFAIKAPASPRASDDAWGDEFRKFHVTLSTALVDYHQTGQASSLATFGPADVMSKLAGATRVAGAQDENAGTFEMRRMRHITTTILDRPRSSLRPTLRVHHEWRAIGVMRHQGHPHERIRDFSCDYTLRVTDRGFELLDCSDWRQLPDEPIEQ